ncbi:MAG: DUF3783 domain-containing protein [Gorillibacterium sp.]|nr:DUF3783 domain-containing protein [Gorillibacterium sp.]
MAASGGKIQQQYYTRARKGLFQAGEGFDTVAKSPGLDNNFIKKILHPYCLYIAPQELARRGERDISLYPAALTVFPVETGELVIGRSIFAGSDFSGQRDVIFAHNYVVPADLRATFLRKPGALFRVTGFASAYDEEAGTSLLELDELDYANGLDPQRPDALLEKLGVSEQLFKGLLYAIFSAVSSKKKVYIILDVDVSESSNRAAELLDILYRCLPYEVRCHFGFTTYNNEPQGRKNIDVMFVEKGSIRTDTRSIGKDFLFDFVSGRFPVEDYQGATDYLDFAWRNRNHQVEWEAYYDFADEALDGLSAQDRLSLSVYSQAVVLYMTAKGNQVAYEADKASTVEALLRFLRLGGLERKPRLNELLLGLIHEEAGVSSTKTQERLTTSSVKLPVRAFAGFIEYYGIAPDSVKPELITVLADLLDRSVVTQKGGTTYLAEASLALKKQPDLQRLIYERIGRELRYAELSEVVLTERMSKVKTIKELQEEIGFWISHSPDSLSLPFFIGIFQEKLKRALHKSGDQAVAGGHLYRFCAQIGKTQANQSGLRSGSGLGSFCQALELETASCVLDTLSISSSTWSELRDAGYLMTDDQLLHSTRLSEEQARKLRVLRVAYEAMISANAPESEGSPERYNQSSSERQTQHSPERYNDSSSEQRTQSSSERHPQSSLDRTLHKRSDSLDRDTYDLGGSDRAIDAVVATKRPSKAFDFRDLTTREIAEIQQLVKRLLEGQVKPDHYNAVVFAFTDWNTSTGGLDRPMFNYDMLVFVKAQTEGTEEVYDFILWTSLQPSFIDTSGRRIRKVYRNALRKYFADADRKALKNRKIFAKLTKDNVSKDFANFIREVRKERMNPLVRLVSHNRKFTLLLALVVVVTAILVISLGGSSDKDKLEPISPSMSPTVSLSPPAGSPVPSASDGLNSTSPVGTDSAGAGSTASTGVTVSPSPESSGGATATPAGE